MTSETCNTVWSFSTGYPPCLRASTLGAMAIMGEAPDSGSAAPAATGHARPARRGRWLKWLGLGLGIGPLLLASLLVACAIALG
ncbi:MAG TPA: hypothetical protein VNN80_29955, partial [Polyangiaceae bacterium]|nr:hypothetical protein [Polyangiaceae bacterium]